MKSNSGKVFAKSTKTTVETVKGIESLHLSFEIKCGKEVLENYVRETGKILTALKLEKVKTLSIKFELLD
jgi:hypothetical protein